MGDLLMLWQNKIVTLQRRTVTQTVQFQRLHVAKRRPLVVAN